MGEHLGLFLGGGQIRVLVLGTGGYTVFVLLYYFWRHFSHEFKASKQARSNMSNEVPRGSLYFSGTQAFFQLTGRESVALRDSYFPSSEQTTSNEVSSNKVRSKEVPGGFLYIFHEGAKRCNYEIPSSPIRSKRANKVKCGETKRVPRRDFCIFRKAG